MDYALWSGAKVSSCVPPAVYFVGMELFGLVVRMPGGGGGCDVHIVEVACFVVLPRLTISMRLDAVGFVVWNTAK